MADGFGYGGFSGVPQPFWLSPPSPLPSASTLPFPPTYLVESYDQTQGRFDPMIPHGSYHQSPSYAVNYLSQMPSSSSYAQTGNLGPRGEDKFSSQGGYYPSMETSSDVVYCPPMERQRLPYSSATVSSLADMLIRNSQEPFYMPIPPSGVCASTNAFDLNRPGHYHPGYGTHETVSADVSGGPPVEPYARVESLPVSSLKTEAFFGGSQTGIPNLGDGRSSVEPLGYGEATGHVKPPDLRDVTVGSTGPRSPWYSQLLQFNAKSSGSLYKEKGEGSGVSSIYQRPTTLVADSETSVSESSLKNVIGDLNCNEHRSLNQFMVSSQGPSAPTMGSESCGAMKADNGNAAQSAGNYKTSFEGSTTASQKTCNLKEQLGIKGSSRSNADDVSTSQSPVCDQGDLPSPVSSPRVSSVVNAMHNLSEVLVYECFNNGSWLKPEQLESLDKVVENLTKCLKKITSNKTIAGEASVPTEAMHASCPNVVDLNEAPNVVAEDCSEFTAKSLDSFAFKESVDKNKNEMTKSIKNILASNFPDGEENHQQTLLYKNLWLETEAALCSTTCLARYHRIQNETAHLKSENRVISSDASTFMQKSDPIMNIVEQDTTESLIKDGAMCHDAPQSSRFNSDPVDAALSLMSRSFTGCLELENHENFKPAAQIPETIHQESPASTKKHNDVTNWFQILKQQETNRKLKSQDCSETRMDEQEDNLEASEMATIGRSSHMSDGMGRFQILKRREAEQVQKSLKSTDLDSDSDYDSEFDSDSDNDEPRNRTQMYDYLWSGSMKTTGGSSKIESCKGYESPTSDWEHVLKDDD